MNPRILYVLSTLPGQLGREREKKRGDGEKRKGQVGPVGSSSPSVTHVRRSRSRLARYASMGSTGPPEGAVSVDMGYEGLWAGRHDTMR